GDIDDVAADQRAQALRAGLEDYELEDEDRLLLETGDVVDAATGAGAALPVLAIVGRPNVGKSALVNRILGRRAAVVEDVPGVTRDRVAYEDSWRGRLFSLVDTGSWAPSAAGPARRVAANAELARFAQDAVVLLVDATVG